MKPMISVMRHAPTPAEDKLWQALRNGKLAGFKFRRQHAIDRYVVDFACTSTGLVIELDGSIHETQQEQDTERQTWLEEQRYVVLRFKNTEVMSNLSDVLQRIESALRRPEP
jgi:very-short-patch-repair endonuclease